MTWCVNGLRLNNRFNVVLARVSEALAFTVKLLKKKKRDGERRQKRYN